MSAKTKVNYAPGSVRGSMAYDLANPELWPDYSYGTPVDIPAAPRIDEGAVVRPETAAVPVQAVSPVAIIGTIIVAALLIFSLLARVQLTRLSDECVSLESSLADLSEQNTKLLIAHESAFNMTEIEDYAENTLGMQKPRSDQIYYVSGSVQDRAVVLGGSGEDVGFADRIGDFISSIAEYFHRGAQ